MTMRRSVLCLVLAAVVMAVMAVPAKRGQWKVVKLEDGTEVNVELVGDEYCHYWQDTDGNAYVRQDGLETYELTDINTLRAVADSVRQASNARRMSKAAMMRNTIGAEHDAYEGTKKGLVILVQFSDVSFADGHDVDLYEQILNEEGFTSDDGFVGSVRDYFLAQSDSLFTIDFDVVGPVTTTYGYAYYGQNTTTGYDKNVRTMLNEACKGVDGDVNFADYDWDDDGYADLVFMLYAGRGEATGGDENTIWPHQGTLTSALRFDGTWVKTYACTNEMRTDTQIDGIGTIAHEFSHCLGLPDTYDTAGENIGMSYWDILDYGCYLGNSFVPCSYTSYERMYCGWQQPLEITGDTTVTDMGALSEGGETYIIYNSGHTDEYYLLENRQQTGWDASLYGEGLLIIHVDFDSNVWKYNEVNTTTSTSSNNDHERMTYIPASGDRSDSYTSQLAAHPWPYSTNTALTRYTDPACELYNENSDGTYYMDKSIIGITQNSDGTIAFVVVDDESLSANKPENAIFYEGFSLCVGAGGNDGTWSGTGVATGTFTPDNDGWTSSQKYGAFQCARFGTNAQTGKATTPEIDIDGKYILSFNAAAWPGDGTSLTLSVDGDATLSETSMTMVSGEWTGYGVTLSGSGTVTISFRASSKSRFYLDEVAIVPSEYSGISTVTTDGTTADDGRIYTIDGRWAGTDMENLPKGIYIIGGKKVIK